MRTKLSWMLVACAVSAPVAAQTSVPASIGGRQAASTSRGTGAAPAERVYLSVNGGWQVASATFDEARSFALNAETARFTSDYEVKSNTAIDASGFVRLWRGLAAGVGMTRFSDSRDISIEGTLPHPFFFRRDRAVSGIAASTREETAVHVQAAFVVPAGRKLQVILFGGPSFFTVKQSVVTDISYRDEFPFDEATFTAATVTTESESKVGFTVGGDVAYYFTRHVGVGGLVRFTRASVTFSLGDVDAGGAIVGGGLRLKF